MDLRNTDLRQTQPVRLTLYGIMGTLAALGVLYGVVSDAEAALYVELGVGVLALVFSTEAARSQAFAPATVAKMLDKDSGAGESSARQ